MSVHPAVVDSSGWIEVFRWVLREHSEAQLSHSLRLPMTGSIILATACIHQARLYTMDTDFQGLNDVELIARHG